MAQAALQIARRGWPVFPCRERDESFLNSAKKEINFYAKAPYGGAGFKDATRQEDRIVSWWRSHPNAMIGVPLGINGCFVVDFDPRTEDIVDPETGEITGTREWTLEQMKAELEALMGVPLPPSLTSRTPSGGVHVWFRHPDDGGAEIRNSVGGKALTDHIDVRGHGGYVVGPPSWCEGGAKASEGEYRWIGRLGDWREDAAIVEAPPELIALLRAPRKKPDAAPGRSAVDRPRQAGERIVSGDVDADVRKYALSALDGECDTIRRAPSGRRNHQLNESAFKVATLVAAGALDERIARLSVESAARDNPGDDDDRQLLATIASGWTAGLNSPRDLGEIAAASRSRRERGQRPSGGRPAPPARPARAAAAKDEPFRPGRLEGRSDLPEGDAARLTRTSEAWMARRCEHAELTRDAIVKLAFSIGRRISAGLIDESAAKQLLWDKYDGVADLQHADVDRAIDDGFNRGFDIAPLLLAMRCARFPLTDFGIGERFRARYGADYRFTTAKGWLGWDGRRWKVLDQDEKSPPAEVIAAVFETVRAIQDEAKFVRDTGVRWALIKEGKEQRLDLECDNPHGMDRWVPKGRSFVLLSDMIAGFGRQSESAGKPAAIAMLARRWLTLPIEDFDRDPLAINVLNGTLRFAREALPEGGKSASVTLEPHRREDLNTKLAPVEYDPAAVCPAYDAFFAWAQPDEGMRRYLHQVAGYAASGDTSEQKLWFWYGLGANGKSTAIDLWAHVVGDYSGTIGIETFLDQGIKKRGEQASPDLARLGGVRLLRASEPERGSKLNEALIKAATGGEPMAVRALHRGFFDLQPLFKLIIGGNYKPDIPGTDEGIWRRMKLVPWNAHVEDKDRDEGLPARLRAEAAGVFNHIVRGMQDWLAHGLIEPAAVKEATQQYREDSDPLARFLSMCTLFDPESRAQSSKLYEVFVAWCKAAGEREWSQKGFSKAMLDKGFVKKASDGMQWIGMKLIRQASDFVDHEGKVRDWQEPDLADASARPPPDIDDVDAL